MRGTRSAAGGTRAAAGPATRATGPSISTSQRYHRWSHASSCRASTAVERGRPARSRRGPPRRARRSPRSRDVQSATTFSTVTGRPGSIVDASGPPPAKSPSAGRHRGHRLIGAVDQHPVPGGQADPDARLAGSPRRARACRRPRPALDAGQVLAAEAAVAGHARRWSTRPSSPERTVSRPGPVLGDDGAVQRGQARVGHRDQPALGDPRSAGPRRPRIRNRRVRTPRRRSSSCT